MNNIYEKMQNDVTYKAYENLKVDLVNELNSKEAHPQRIANLVFLIKKKKADLLDILDYYMEKDLYSTDGRIGYLMASHGERKYMNPDGTAKLEAITELCDRIDNKCEVNSDGR